MRIMLKNKWPIAIMAFMVGITLASCNKDVPDPVPIEYPTPSGTSIGELLTTNPSYSLLKTAVTRAGLMPALTDKKTLYTLFAPDNAAFGRIGITSDAQINGLPLTTLVPLIQYHVIGGAKLVSSAIPDTFPNAQMPTLIILPQTIPNPLVRMTTFPSRRGSAAFVNNIPVTTADIQAANGVIHNVFIPVFPPTRVLADTLSRDTTFSFLMAAIARADAGLPSGAKFSQLLARGELNFTVFAPTNNAFRALYTALGLPPDASTVNLLPIPTVIGIVAYHIHIKNNTPPTPGSAAPFTGSRAFSVNLPTTPTAINTWLKVVLAPNPAPPLVISAAPTATVKGFANATASNITAVDRHCVNGVYHVIDQVLRPQ